MFLHRFTPYLISLPFHSFPCLYFFPLSFSQATLKVGSIISKRPSAVYKPPRNKSPRGFSLHFLSFLDFTHTVSAWWVTWTLDVTWPHHLGGHIGTKDIMPQSQQGWMEESLLFESASDSWIIELWTYTQHFFWSCSFWAYVVLTRTSSFKLLNWVVLLSLPMKYGIVFVILCKLN